MTAITVQKRRSVPSDWPRCARDCPAEAPAACGAHRILIGGTFARDDAAEVARLRGMQYG